jgi:hypothetical protein
VAYETETPPEVPGLFVFHNQREKGALLSELGGSLPVLPQLAIAFLRILPEVPSIYMIRCIAAFRPL